MAIVQKQVDYCQELDSLLAVVVQITADVIQKKSPSQVVQDSASALLAALTGLSQLGAELSNQVALDNTIALKLGELKRALAPSLP